MRATGLFAAVLLVASAAAQDEPPLPPPNRTPVLVLDQGGRAAPVAAVAFSPDSATLYVGGADKQVWTYTLRGDKYMPAGVIRVPIGPGNAGDVNAIAVAPDNKWVAVAGRAPMRDEAWFGQDGVVTLSKHLPPLMRKDLGVVYLFDPANPNGKNAQVLRGPVGEVRALAFATPTPPGGPVLVTASVEPDEQGQTVGVVRVWDVTAGKELARRADFPPTRTLPGLAAWPSGKGGHAVKVALAWEQPDKAGGELRVWDTGTDEVKRFADGSFNSFLAVRPGPDGAPKELLSGGFVNHIPVTGQPQFGQVVARPADGGDPTRDPHRFPSEGGFHYLPRGVAAAGDATVAVVEIDPKPVNSGTGRPAELRFIDAQGKRRPPVPLRGVSARVFPAVVGSPDGKWVAVSGFADHRVEVYAAAALGAGRAEPQVLPGMTDGFTQVKFLAGDKLWVGGPGDGPTKGGVVFDFPARQAKGNDGRGVLDNPPDTSKAVPQRGPDGVVRVAVTAGGRTATYSLRGTEVPTQVAYLPAGAAWRKGAGAIVAIAHREEENGVTLVTLFDAATGRRLRQLIGPSQPITYMAFSATRPLLAGVSGDRTVSVWSLRDLDAALGSVEGLVVTDTPKGVTVVSADDGKLLAAGAVIEAVGTENGKLEPVKSAGAFRLAVGAIPVGAKVAVQAGGRRVLLPVGRGVLQRGPLVNLWLGPPAAEGVEWVGWNPAGPYDASSPAAEDRIGWQTATGDPADPVAFAPVGQYRKEFYRRDLLRFLLDRGELTDGLDAWRAAYPLQQPALVARVRSEGALGGLALLRDRAEVLEILLHDPHEVLPDGTGTARWRGTGPDGRAGEWQEVQVTRGRITEVSLKDYAWSRGRHMFAVELVRPEVTPRVTAAAGAVSIPTAPTISVLVDGRPVRPGVPVFTEKEAVEVAAEVKPGSGGPAGVSVNRTHEGESQPAVPLPRKDGTFGPHKLDLKPGSTTLRVTATTEGAGEFAASESATVEVRVVSTPKPKPVPAPKVGRLKLNPEPAAGNPPVVDVPAVTVAVTVTGEKPVNLVEWDAGGGKWVPAKINPALEVTDELKVALEPGKPRTIRVRARSQGGEEFATEAVAVVYHPLPPAAALDPPAGSSVTNSDLTVTGTYEPPPAGVNATLRVVVTSGDQVRTSDAALDSKIGRWTAAVSLFPGDNQLGLEVANDWRKESRPALASVTYRRPPALLGVAPPNPGKSAVADVVAAVVAARGTGPTVLVIDGRQAETRPRRLAGLFGAVWWELTAPGLPVKVGDTWLTTLSVSARNAEGDSRSVAVKLPPPPPPPPPPPQVALSTGSRTIEPGQSLTTDRPTFPLALTVTSKVRPGKVEVWRKAGTGASPERLHEIDPNAAVQGADGFTLAGEHPVALRRGLNVIRVEAVNEGGRREFEFTVSYAPPPVRVEITAVQELGPGEAVVNLHPGPAPPGGFRVNGAFVRVVGFVEWSATDDPAARSPDVTAVLYANDVAHLPVQLEPPAGPGRARAFSAPVFLNAEETRVRIELRTDAQTTVPQRLVSGSEFAVRCAAPHTKQRLHVVVVGLGVPAKDRPALARGVVAAIGGKAQALPAGFDRGEFEHGAFTQAHLYAPLVEGVDQGNLVLLLTGVGEEIRRQARFGGDRWVNDVILVYYQGQDLIGPDGKRWLHTTRSLRYTTPQAAAGYVIRVQDLPATPGLLLVLLNVFDRSDSPNRDRVAKGPPVLRYVWKEDKGLAVLLPLSSQAVATAQKFGDWVSRVTDGVVKNPLAVGTTDELPDAVKNRRIGGGEQGP